MKAAALEEAFISEALLQMHAVLSRKWSAHPKVAEIAIQETISLIPLCEPKAHMWLCRLDASILHAVVHHCPCVQLLLSHPTPCKETHVINKLQHKLRKLPCGSVRKLQHTFEMSATSQAAHQQHTVFDLSACPPCPVKDLTIHCMT